MISTPLHPPLSQTLLNQILPTLHGRDRTTFCSLPFLAVFPLPYSPWLPRRPPLCSCGRLSPRPLHNPPVATSSSCGINSSAAPKAPNQSPTSSSPSAPRPTLLPCLASQLTPRTSLTWSSPVFQTNTVRLQRLYTPRTHRYPSWNYMKSC